MRPLVTELIVPNDDILVEWVGPEPRLRTADEDTTYVETYTAVGFGFPAVKTKPTVASAWSITVTVQLQSSVGFVFHGIYLQDLDGSFSTGSSLLIDETNSQNLIGRAGTPFAGDVWHTFTYRLRPGVDYEKAAVEAALAAGRLAVLSDVSPAGRDESGDYGPIVTPDDTVKTSQLDLVIGGADKWLRGVQRNDGLSHCVPRGVQVSSRQRSLRGVGYQ